MNKYTNWYHSITERARTRSIDSYTECHHIQPRSLGGTDDKDNLVDLTAREHFICHWLLTKMHTGEARAKMIYALNGMKRNNEFTNRYETKITARVYEKLKKEFSVVHSATMKGKTPINKGRPMSEEQKAKIRATKAANPTKRSAEAIAKTVAKQIGQKRSQETKDKIRDALKGKPKGPMSEEEKLKRSIALKGKPKPEGFGKHLIDIKRKQFTSQNPNRRQDLKKECPHCNGIFGPSNYARWHGPNCRALKL